ncbi:hypothetical protein B0H10DRAFT_1954878 [Mycena sp. CBHHK59/15]|nr:hypothetical protein B0H10DRAFT_1954878 [Mycena sp. CBHHK59/15]
MLGDNPMQSEFACHIGFKGKLFCRVCWAKGVPEQVDDEDEDEDEGNKTDGKKKHTKKKDESVMDMVSRIGQFMSSARLRSATETQKELWSQFKTAREVGGQAGFKRRKTESGIKDTFQGAFLDRIFAISSKRGRKKVQKQADIAALLRTFPDDITSPTLILTKTLLLRFYMSFCLDLSNIFGDAVARVKKSDQDILVARLSSFNVSGLGISPLPGHTLVNYSGSLTGRDFRTIVQVAPFVLQGLLPAEYIELWTSLSAVVTLVWQPHINDLDTHIEQLEAAIKHILDCTCRLTLQWFNKPKFHLTSDALAQPCFLRQKVLNPSMQLYVHAVYTATGMPPHMILHPGWPKETVFGICEAEAFFLQTEIFKHQLQDTLPDLHGWIFNLKIWKTATGCKLVLHHSNWWNLIHLEHDCLGGKQLRMQHKVVPVRGNSSVVKVFTPKAVTLNNGDSCEAGSWVAWTEIIGQTSHHRIGCVAEIVQIVGSKAYQAGAADFVLVTQTIVGEVHDLYKMRWLQPIPNEYQSVKIKDIKCTVNIQHNCADNKCQCTRSRVVLNEQDKTSERALAIQHTSDGDFIVNTAQMRDAAALDPFRFTPNALITANVIRVAAEKAFADRQRQKKSVIKPTEAGGEQQEVDEEEPQRKKTRTTDGAQTALLRTAPSTGRACTSNPRVPQKHCKLPPPGHHCRRCQLCFCWI